MTSGVRHPIFARVYERLSRIPDEFAAEKRAELLSGLSGRVIEVGAGNGLNFGHYPPEVTEIVAVEPEPYLRQRARQAATERIRVVDAIADALPAADGEFDAAVASLVLCSVPSQATALGELRRVIRPGGELRFYEHVVAQEPTLARWQRRAKPVWMRIGGGCHPDRDTVAAIVAAGFEITRADRFDMKGPLVLVRPHVLGAARNR